MTGDLYQQAQTLKPRLVELRRQIHRQPELVFDLPHTSALVAETLRAAGWQVRSGVGKSGVVARRGHGNGKVIGIRADMDALPIQEVNEVPYASQNAGRMHACGHDAHTACLLGVSMLLAEREIAGEVRLLFQPAEEDSDAEGISGATRMIEDGALAGVDHVIALHVDGTLETGRIRVVTGGNNAAVDTVRARILGRGGHGAYPHETNDPIWLAVQVMNALYAIPSRRIDPLQPNVVSVGVIQGGSASNVIPPSVYLEVTLRSFDPKVREQLLVAVEQAFALVRNFGADYEFNVERGYPVLWNDAQVAEVIRRTALEMLGANCLTEPIRTMGAEDFSYMTEVAPGAMFSLGAMQPGGSPRMLHTPTFDIDENALPIGAAMLAECALQLMKS
ncbi:MAG: amidohydrolase [Anaerolineae bacterium]|nr:amidohydrolase [Anaerolineae bacterium]